MTNNEFFSFLMVVGLFGGCLVMYVLNKIERWKQ